MAFFKSLQEKIEILTKKINDLKEEQQKQFRIVEERNNKLSDLVKSPERKSKLIEGFRKDIKEAENQIKSIAEQIIKKEEELIRLEEKL